MVFARAKLVLQDNCFEEDPGRLDIKFVGPGVLKLYKHMYELMKAVFDVSASDIQETTHNWGKTANGEKFKITWSLHKDIDMFSYFYVDFELSGQGNDKTGNAFIRIKPLLRSEYPQDTIWQRSLFYEILRTFWHRIFYHKKREEYAEDCRNSVVLFEKRMKDFLHKLK